MTGVFMASVPFTAVSHLRITPVVMDSLTMVPPGDRFLTPIPNGRGSNEQGLRSMLLYRLELFFSLNVLSIWVPGHNSVPGNVAMFFNHNGGILLHIMWVRFSSSLVHFCT